MVNKIQKDSRIEYILQNESVFGILIIISLYGSQNLQHLSILLKKKPNSLIYHVQKLVENDLIEIDSSKISLPGKYYSLTNDAKIILNEDLTASFIGLEDSIKEFIDNKDKKLEDLSQFTYFFSGIFSLAKVMSNLLISSIESSDFSIRDGKLYKNDTPFGPLQVHVDMVDIEDKQDDQKITELTNRYVHELEQISSQIEAKNKSKNSSKIAEHNLFGEAKRFRFIYNFSAIYDKEV